MHKLFLTLIIAIFGCVSCDTQTENLPDSKSLDKITDANSSLLYDWNEESAKNEKSIPNEEDLDIKVNRKVSFSFKGKKYILYPFFKKTAHNKQILFLHFLLTESTLDLNKLKDISFKDLKIIDSNKAYYYYN
ncbi:hypothetical protein [Fluviicola taffensis]|uniref:hypothetical protein n=1 Tax=Fluviicola taffensis TaxID=191579 RepID=UPI003137BB43